jgi:carbonic anhydrase
MKRILLTLVSTAYPFLSSLLCATLIWIPPQARAEPGPAKAAADTSTSQGVAPAGGTGSAATHGAVTPEQALERLIQGNARYVGSTMTHPNQTKERRLEQAKGQTPFAIILTCSDSRVSPELFFDQGLGDLFVIRNAGNVLDDHVLGSVEYAVEHLHVGLIVVVGHGKCGAVSATVGGGEVPGHIRSVTEAIAPALEEVKNQPGDKVENTVRANAQRMAGILTHVEPILKEAVKGGHLRIVAAHYDISSGQVEILK